MDGCHGDHIMGEMKERGESINIMRAVDLQPGCEPVCVCVCVC